MEVRRFPTNAPRDAMLRVAYQYADAIVRRDREPTDPEWLAGLWADVGAHFVRLGQSFLMLRKLGPVFVASHFAPHTMRGGYRLLRAIAAAGLPVVFAVPEDLARDLDRIGWKRLPAWAVSALHSRGMPREKVVLVPGGMLGLAWSLLRNGDFHCSLDADVPDAEPAKNPRKRITRGIRRSRWTHQAGSDTFRPFAGLQQLLSH